MSLYTAANQAIAGQEEATLTPAPSPTPAWIMVVDDDAMSRRMISKALQRDGHQTKEAADGAQALALMENSLPSIVLMDVEMPIMDGICACAALRQLYGNHVPVLMVTGSDDTDSVDRAFEAGATDFTSKPINLALLSHRVRYLLRTNQLMLELAHTVKELDDSRAKLRNLAYYDSLTRLPNRESFMRRLQLQLSCEDRLVVMFLDVDNFKRINDTLGHATGDLLLQTLASRLETCIRDCDVVYPPFSGDEENSPTDEQGAMVARFGGDEFTVLLNNVPDAACAKGVAQRILETLNEPMLLAGHEMVISPSIGVALYPEDGNDAETLLKHADAAMYTAKSGGKNNFQFFSSSDHVSAA